MIGCVDVKLMSNLVVNVVFFHHHDGSIELIGHCHYKLLFLIEHLNSFTSTSCIHSKRLKPTPISQYMFSCHDFVDTVGSYNFKVLVLVYCVHK